MLTEKGQTMGWPHYKWVSALPRSDAATGRLRISFRGAGGTLPNQESQIQSPPSSFSTQFPPFFYITMAVKKPVVNSIVMSPAGPVNFGESTTASTTEKGSRGRNALVGTSGILIRPSVRKSAAKITVRSSCFSCAATNTNVPIRTEEEAREEGSSPRLSPSFPMPAVRRTRQQGSRS